MKRTGVVYLIAAGPDVTRFSLSKSGLPLIKLGYSGDYEKRLRSHGSARGDALDTLFTYKTDDMVAVEACAKAVLKGQQYRKYKEIYEAEQSVLESAILGCGTLIAKVQRAVKRQKGGGDSHPLPKTFLVFSTDP